MSVAAVSVRPQNPCAAPYGHRERVLLWSGPCPRHPATHWVEIHTGKTPDEDGNLFSPFVYCLLCRHGKYW